MTRNIIFNKLNGGDNGLGDKKLHQISIAIL